MKSVSLMSNDETGNRYELWQAGDTYRLRTWHVSPSGVTHSGHSITLTGDELEQLGEDIHKHLFSMVERPGREHCFRHDKAIEFCRLTHSVNCDPGEVMV